MARPALTSRLLTVLLPALALCWASCSKSTDDSDADGSDGATLTVQVRGQGADGGAMTVSRPIHIYAFGSDGSCRAQKSIGNEKQSAAFSLPAATYTLCAVAGTDGDSYDVPQKDTAIPSSAITLKGGTAHADIMAATPTAVTTGTDEGLTVTLPLQRQVWMLTKVTVRDVPQSVGGILLRIDNLHESITLSGTATGDAGWAEVSLQKQDDGTTWQAVSNQYLLEPDGEADISFTLTMTDGTQKTLHYVSSKELKANHKVSLNTSYEQIGTPSLRITVEGSTWEGETDISIDIRQED